MNQLNRIQIVQQAQSIFTPTPYITELSSQYSVPVDINDIFLNITKDVTIKPIHSHNDYTRQIPLLEALSYGVQSVEADIWSFAEDDEVKTETISTGERDEIRETRGQTRERETRRDTRRETEEETKASDLKDDVLYVAHTLPEIKPNWSLNSLYLDPIYWLLKQSNFLNRQNNNGIFMFDPSHTLYLFIDFKTKPDITWPLLVDHLKRFRDDDFLTYYNDEASKWVIRPLTIVLTGDIPEDQVKALPVRYVTLDGDLALFKGDNVEEAVLQAQQKYSIIASKSMAQMLDSVWFQARYFSLGERKKLRDAINKAHKYNIKTRIWGGVTWRNRLRDSEDMALYNMGTDFVNIDDLSMSGRYRERR